MRAYSNIANVEPAPDLFVHVRVARPPSLARTRGPWRDEV